MFLALATESLTETTLDALQLVVCLCHHLDCVRNSFVLPNDDIECTLKLKFNVKPRRRLVGCLER